MPTKAEKDILGEFIKQYGDIPAKMIFSANERRGRLRQRIQLHADGCPLIRRFFVSRTMTTMEAGIIGGDDFLRLCEESSNRRFSGASKASLSQRLPASLRMRRAQGKKRAVLRRLFRGCGMQRQWGRSLSISVVCSAPRLLKSFL